MNGETELIVRGPSVAITRVGFVLAVLAAVAAGIWLIGSRDTQQAPAVTEPLDGRQTAVVNEIVADDGTRVQLVCQLGDFDRFDLRQVNTDAEGLEIISNQATIARPRAMDNCRGCSVNESTSTPVGDPVLFGNCVTGMANAASVAYAVVTPSAETSALAFRLDCGVTNLRESPDGLLLISSDLRNDQSTVPRAQILLRRTPGGFEPDQPALFGHYCLGTDALVDTAAGAVRLDSNDIVALYPASCDALSELVDANGANSQPLADLLGQAPPTGGGDWRLRCAPST